ncbi:NUDIX hydrolase [Labrys monachus]|uniref:8-oxo-dGTP pyrophosphatase MutT (NUDIX family) n=1 Tax=Labrys monachus TaxID=217067 RepID=A0ABU0FKS4_9HYPH|nr:NUDIX hydrolase [Labrys monachus]MDQ0395213.1 8-oxo-dGTP pyrophosphatase MutT (NUDIX family) [Labrys monachus]
MSETAPRIVEIEAIDCRFEPVPWAFAQDNRAAIAEHWQAVVAHKPETFNGKVLLMHRWEIVGGLFVGAYLMTDYASFLAWRDFGFPDRAKWNCFSMAALQSADGAFLLGEMADHTSNAGAIYFAAGTPDPSDLAGDTVDLAASVMREMAEETGLSAAEVTVGPGWTAVFHGSRIALIRNVHSPLGAAELKRRIEGFLAGDPKPELSRMHVVSRRADILAERMPAFQCAYLEHRLAG